MFLTKHGKLGKVFHVLSEIWLDWLSWWESSIMKNNVCLISIPSPYFLINLGVRLAIRSLLVVFFSGASLENSIKIGWQSYWCWSWIFHTVSFVIMSTSFRCTVEDINKFVSKKKCVIYRIVAVVWSKRSCNISFAVMELISMLDSGG